MNGSDIFGGTAHIVIVAIGAAYISLGNELSVMRNILSNSWKLAAKAYLDSIAFPPS